MLAVVVTLGAVSVLSVLLRRHVPVTADRSMVDDVLYARMGTFLAHGQWLGPFDQYTMLKGPGYPALIAWMYRSGVPLKVGEQLTDLLAAAAVAGCVWIVTRRRALGLAAFVVLALDPVNFSNYESRVTRDGWYGSLSMLFVATFFLVVYGAITRGRLLWLVPLSMFAGASGAAFWLCREEGPWIAPTILLVALGLPFCLLIRWWYKKPRTRPERNRVIRMGGRLGLLFAILAAALVAPVVFVAVENSRHYGVAMTDDLVSGQFARAYADWTRVEAGTPSAADPITRSQREAVYGVSSAARELEPYVDPVGLCRKPCGENVWRALRDAAADAGHFHSESDAQRYFGELDAQIQAACASDQLRCSARLPTDLQSLQRFSVGPLFTYARHWGVMLLTSTGFDNLTTTARTLGPRRELFSRIVPSLPASEQAADDQMSRFDASNWPYRLLSDVYRPLLPCSLVMALIGLVVPLARPRWPQAALSVLSGALLIGALVRLFFVGLLNTTAFLTAGSDVRYLLPAHALLIAFGAVGTAQFTDALWTRIRLRRGERPSGLALPTVVSATN